MAPFQHIVRDLRFGFQQLLRQPVFSLVAIVALGFGIGSVTTQLSVTNGVLFKPLPFPESRSLMHLERVNVLRANAGAEPKLVEFIEWERRQEVFEGLAGFYNGTANLSHQGFVKRYDGCFISGNAFALLGVEAALGRPLSREDDLAGSPPVMLLSHRTWQEDFGADPGLVGQSIVVNGRPTVVVGVMPEGFAFPLNEHLWLPLLQHQQPREADWLGITVTLEAIGRLKPGVSREQAEAAMSSIAKALEEERPASNEGYRQIKVKPLKDEFMGEQTLSLTGMMMLITVLMLVIACANLANLLLARAMKRQREIAIRSALGATRRRILAQFLTESLLLAGLAAIFGLFLARFNLQQIESARTELQMPAWMNFSMDSRVFMGAVGVTLATGFLCGWVPAYRASRLNENEILKDTNRTATSLHLGKFSRLMVILQISVAAVVLSLVVLFVRSMHNAQSLDYAYNPDDVLSARLGLFDSAYPDEAARARFVESLLTRLRERPEIAFAAMTDRYRFTGGPLTAYTLEEAGGPLPEPELMARYQQVSPGFFKVMQLDVLQGRAFQVGDFTGEGPRQAIVNEAFALRSWDTTDCLGRRFQANLGTDWADPADRPWLEVVGVVAGMQEADLFSARDDGAAFLVPRMEGTCPQFLTILVRGHDAPDHLIPVLREELAALDPHLPLYEVGTPRESNERQTAQFAFFSNIFTGFGLLTALLAGLGIYGVITYSVNHRVMEFGIRQALGATRPMIFRLIYKQALIQLASGFFIALLILSPVILSPAVKGVLAMFFLGIHHDSLAPYLLAFGFVTLIALVSAAPPAFRAARIAPAEALRHE